MKKSGFTIIEMAIALAVSIILMGIAIPRYNNLLVSQEFTAEVQKIATCIQQAQSMAAAPRADLLKPNSQGNALSPRWVAAQVNISDGVVFSCNTVAIDATTSFAALAIASPDDQLTMPVKTTDIKNVKSESFRIYFGVLEKGAPVAFISDTKTQKEISGSGIKVSIPFTSSTDVCPAGAPVGQCLSASIIVEQAGAPIHVITP